MQLLMVLSGYSSFVSGDTLLMCRRITQSHWPSTRLEIVFVDIRDTSHHHHLNF